MRGVATKSGAAVESPWFTAEEAAAYLRIESDDGSLHAFYLAYPRLGIPAYRFRGGRELRFRQEDLDAALTRARVQDDEPRSQAGETERKLALASSNRASSGEENRKPLRGGRGAR